MEFDTLFFKTPSRREVKSRGVASPERAVHMVRPCRIVAAQDLAKTRREMALPFERRAMGFPFGAKRLSPLDVLQL